MLVGGGAGGLGDGGTRKLIGIHIINMSTKQVPSRLLSIYICMHMGKMDCTVIAALSLFRY